MRIGILGAGSVGGTLGRRFATMGHTVLFGLRDPQRGAAAVDGGPTDGAPLPDGAHVVEPAEAVRDTGGQRVDVLLVATPWKVTAELLRALVQTLGADAFTGLPVFDCTNPLGAGMRVEIGPGGMSGAEQLQALLPGARVVKVFNSTGFANMADPSYDGAATIMPYAGDDAGAKAIARDLCLALGFEAVDAGPLVRARELEHLAALWIGLAYGSGGVPGLGRDIAFRLVRR